MTNFSEPLALRIIALLTKGQMSKVQICQAMNLDYVHVARTFTELLRTRRVVVLGHSHQAPIYGLPGDTLRKEIDKPTKAHGEKAGHITIGKQMMKPYPGGRRDSE